MKKNRIKAVLVLLALTAVIALSAVTVPAASSIKRKTTAALNLRKTPSAKATVLTTVPQGTTVTLTMRTKDSSWYKTTYKKGSKSYTGWLYAKYLEKLSGSDAQVGTSQKTAVQVVMRSSAKVTSSNKITTIKKNKTVKVSKLQNSNWYKITYGGKTGYIQVGFFQSDRVNGKIYKITNAKINMRKKAKVASGNVITVIPVGAKVQVLSESGTWFKISYGGKTGYIKSGYFRATEDSASSEVKETLGVAVNLRTQPKVAASTKIRTLDAGSKVTVVSEYNSSWLYVKASDGTYGYIKAGNFKSDASSNQSTGITKAALRIRASRSTNASILEVIPKNTEVTILASYSGWYKVKYSGVTGYVSDGYFK